ncbi:MAG: cob(I)yrinic acid a,c-diamide adenosyltransferase [Candidatus Humimicrobiaceae bacterium]
MAGLGMGYIQVYTGDGKGKTTAALGLTLRASGYGLKVFIAQFIKGMKYNEITALERFKNNVTVKQYGNGYFIRKEPSEIDIEMANNGLKEIRQILTSGSYDVVILDEINSKISELITRYESFNYSFDIAGKVTKEVLDYDSKKYTSIRGGMTM